MLSPVQPKPDSGKTSNNEHPISNSQWSVASHLVRCWALDVGGWRFCGRLIFASMSADVPLRRLWLWSVRCDLRAKRAKPKAPKGRKIIAQGKRSAALGDGAIIINTPLFMVCRASRRAGTAGHEERGVRLMGVRLPRAAVATLLCWAALSLPLRGGRWSPLNCAHTRFTGRWAWISLRAFRLFGGYGSWLAETTGLILVERRNWPESFEL